MGVRAQFRTSLRRPGYRIVLNWDLTPNQLRQACMGDSFVLSPSNILRH